MRDFQLNADGDLVDGNLAEDDESIAQSCKIALQAWKGESPLQPNRGADWHRLAAHAREQDVVSAVIAAISRVRGVSTFGITGVRIDPTTRVVSVDVQINGTGQTIDV
jgi:phage baseplate assembly protein W|nr:MAG TPA: secretion system protein [Caudoviricetes sp.]